MEWLDNALDQFFSNRSPSGFWKEFTDKINIKNPTAVYGLLNEYLESNTFLNGHELSAEDFYLVNTLKKCPS